MGINLDTLTFSLTIKITKIDDEEIIYTMNSSTVPSIDILRDDIKRIDVINDNNNPRRRLGFEEAGIDEFLANPLNEITRHGLMLP